MVMGINVETIPTQGFVCESLSIRGHELVLYDVGGCETIRRQWKDGMFSGNRGLIWVVDATDHARIAASRDELHRVLTLEQLANSAVLVLCNKLDFPGALSEVEVGAALQLEQLRRIGHATRPLHIHGCSARTGAGLFPGMLWLLEAASLEAVHIEARIARCMKQT